ncbi:hypothetical protein BB347_08865 [Natronorubrum daqingense]|nr:hypothetical protein BB347_08865 [Natronorubrum daqingense]
MAWHNCQTVSDIEQRCEFVDQLYEQIRTQGYQTQAEITIQTSYPRELTNEVLVDIGRNGQLLFINGQHRLAIAKILELETIPVTVMVRHTNWMETLAAEYQRGDVRTHPDVGHLEA